MRVPINITDVAAELETAHRCCLPGRQAAEGSSIWWALSRMLQEPIRIIRQPAGAPLRLIDMS
jgi:hypothetical protein